ncbi:MAG: [FeFe] hydrogenase H-cluster radical SAM maturase HydE [Bacteroidales bacterium]|jgi:biotin synthase|nr:[FeFe] hydrogenase H-cluster radical SAM maturase HydE [Bacteroidales bacterium]MCK9499398.1 [FeFe] hydrogenase H-cluster radical SAM maturase HydE [Bacteroidales bacterium]MDY0314559.1 [FeFe] hydrogenase H-cluster radical SAM maturase HydE [Bacteroidales bacterium]
MHNKIADILQNSVLNKDDLIILLSADKENSELIFKKAAEIKSKCVGNFTYFRGLIELSNICSKNCLYCGIRNSNKEVERYVVSDEEIFNSVQYALDRDWGSVVIQSGERMDTNFINKVEYLIKKISQMGEKQPGITLSLGEQKIDTFKRWFDAGATRYLLRIESSNPKLFAQIHPQDKLHNYEKRIENLYNLQKLGYMTGTGVMIGLPFQTIEDLADDLLFMKKLDIDMVGMGPYIEHENTPLYQYKDLLLPVEERYFLSLKMIAVLRILMRDVNIASATALQAINPDGREEGIRVGANVIMPNITPLHYHKSYNLYKGKPDIIPETDNYIKNLEKQIALAGDTVGYGEKGDPKHFFKRTLGN